MLCQLEELLCGVGRLLQKFVYLCTLLGHLLLQFGVHVHHSTVSLGDLLEEILELAVFALLLALLMMLLLARALLLDLHRTFVLGSRGCVPSLVAVIFSLLLDVVFEGVGGVGPRLVLVI